ncbi:MAG: tyrosine-protein phosphatase [Anaerolineae bacterium]
MLQHRDLEIEGSWNVRDIGGYPTADGGTTRWGVLLRSGDLARVSPAGQQALINYGVRTIIDLRDLNEVRSFPNVFAQSPAVAYHHLPVQDDVETGGSIRLDSLYRNFIDACQPNLSAVVTTAAESEPGVLIHCFAGKDRTGVVVALLLGAVGVPDAVIAEDYALTSGRITHLVESWRAWAIQQGHDMTLFEHEVSSEAATMQETLRHIRQTYGGIPDYLRACGVTDAQLARLRALLVE